MDRGFHPGFKTLIDNFYLQNHSTNLIIVVRDSILDEVIQKYNIRDFYLLNSESIKLMNKLKSIILCGGDSSRMKSDKALLLYHGIPQYRYCQSLLNVFSVETYLSINNNQLDFIGNKIVDIDHFHGPLRGLVSCIEQIIDCPILLMGVDYPLAGVNEIMQLILNYDQDVDSICFYNEGQNIFEPIFSIYNPSFISKLKSVTEENTSIQSLLKGSNVKKIYLPMSHKLISFDNINQYHEFNNAKGN
jgi:molybdopterin-guanine dinucleotide biosynthesis protein A